MSDSKDSKEIIRLLSEIKDLLEDSKDFKVNRPKITGVKVNRVVRPVRTNVAGGNYIGR